MTPKRERRYDVRRNFADGTFDIYTIVTDDIEYASLRAKYSEPGVVSAFVISSFDLTPQHYLAGQAV